MRRDGTDGNICAKSAADDCVDGYGQSISPSEGVAAVAVVAAGAATAAVVAAVMPSRENATAQAAKKREKVDKSVSSVRIPAMWGCLRQVSGVAVAAGIDRMPTA
jgi:hypothetical protein